MTRKAARATYDAQILLDPSPGHIPAFAFALAKLTFELKDGKAVPAEAKPLLFDIWNDPNLEPKMPPGSDYWFDKSATDVVVRGSAYGSDGKPFDSSSVSIKIGDIEKRIAVFGPRRVEWSKGGAAKFTAPELVDKVPLLYQLAYGGLDERVPMPEEQREPYFELVKQGMQYDHPGLYPRNPVGKGYLALPGPVPELELPNLEDPTDLLTPERLVPKSPNLWYLQPLPWCYEWTVGLTFPRYSYLDVSPWFPAPDGQELLEVARGFFPPNLSKLLEDEPEAASGYVQEASLGMSFEKPLAGSQVILTGMHPEFPSQSFEIPASPQFVIEIEGNKEASEAKLTNFVIFPDENLVTLTYVAMRPLSRAFIPGIHQEIPISVSINGDEKIAYEAPPTINKQLKDAKAGAAGGA